MEFPVTIDSQDAFDGLVKDRLARERAKFSDYDEIKSRAEAAEQAAAEHQAAIDAANQRADQAEQWKAEREKSDELAKVREDVAKEAGVPATALRGSSKEEFEAHAAELKPLLTGHLGPVIPSQGDFPDHPATDQADERAAVRTLFGSGEG